MCLFSRVLLVLAGESRVESWSVHEAYWVLFLLVFERIRDMSKRYSQEFKGSGGAVAF